MTALPNPFLDSAALIPILAADAVASALPSAPAIDATAPQSPMAREVQEAAAVNPQTQAAAVTDHFGSDISDVHEIFYRARMLIAEDKANHHRFVLDQRAFEEAIEPPPMFLQRVG